MTNSSVRKKRLKLGFREIRSLLRRTQSTTIRRECIRILKASRSYFKISKSYERELLSLREKNIHLAHAAQQEKENYTYILHEKNILESSFLDLQRENACLKTDLRKYEKIFMEYDEDLKNNMIPNLVRISDDITKFKSKNDIIKKIIENRGNGDAAGLPKNSWSNGVNFGTNGNQPVSTVNPMVKGCVIQKPTINVRRVSIPNENRRSLFANIDIASPILEEPEEELGIVASGNRKCKNGLRHVISISNANVISSSIPSVPLPEISYRNRSDDITDSIDMRMEPVVRLSDVTRMLQNSSFRVREPSLESSAPQKRYSSPLNHFSPEILLERCKTPKPSNTENESENNPLEGCSWMHRNNNSSLQFEKSPSGISTASQDNARDWNNAPLNGMNREKSNRNSAGKENSPTESHEYVEKNGIFSHPPSPPNSGFSVMKKESFYSRASTAILHNESSAPVKDNTFLSSTLNSVKKKKFFPETDDSSVFFTTRRRLPKSVGSPLNLSPLCSESRRLLKSVESSTNLSPLGLERSFQMKQAETSESNCLSNLQSKVDVPTSSIPDKEKEKPLRTSNRKSNKNSKKKKIKPGSTCNVENLSPVETSIRSGKVSVVLDNCISDKKKSTAEKKTLKSRRKKSLSDNSDSYSTSTVGSFSESALESDESSRPRRSTRKRQCISYKEPDLGKKLRREDARRS